jgi:hypothetical protein
MGWIRGELEDTKLKDGTEKKGGLTLYMEALLGKVDQYLDAANTRQLVVEDVVKYTFSPVPGRWEIDGEALWPQLRNKKVSRTMAYDFVVVEKHTVQKEGYMRHTIKLLRPPE